MYAMRSDGTVVGPAFGPQFKPGDQAAYKLWPNQSSGLMRSKPLASIDAKAVFDPKDLTVVYDTTATAMLTGVAPKESHGFLGMLGGLAAGGMILGGPAGWLGGALAGIVVGHLIETHRSDVQMSPVIPVK